MVRDIQLRVKSQPRVEGEWSGPRASQTSTPAAISIVLHEVAMGAGRAAIADHFIRLIVPGQKNCLYVILFIIVLKMKGTSTFEIHRNDNTRLLWLWGEFL